MGATNKLYNLIMGLGIIGLSGCTLSPDMTTEAERLQRAQTDLAELFPEPLPIHTLTLSMAIARGISYNLEHRVKAMKIALAHDMGSVMTYEGLPKLALSAGYTERSRVSSSTQDLRDHSASLALSWNVLDFGASYIRARQQANRILIVQEQYRKSAHNIVQTVTANYWRAVTAQQLKPKIDKLLIQLKHALTQARKAEKKRLQPPMEILDYQKNILETLYQIQQLWQQLSSARVRLFGLININPNSNTRLTVPPMTIHLDQIQQLSMMSLERYALTHRPELREQDYQLRIQQDESKKAILKMVPGLSFIGSGEHNSTTSYLNHNWAEASIKLAWNLIKLASIPATLAKNKSQERLYHLQRLALTMTALVQVHVAYLRLQDARETYNTTFSISEVNDKLYRHAKAGLQAASMNELELIRRQTDQIMFQARRDIAFAELRSAATALLVSLGADILPDMTTVSDISALEKTIAERMPDWSVNGLLGGLQSENQTTITRLIVVGQKGIPGAVVTNWEVMQRNYHFRPDVSQVQWVIQENLPVTDANITTVDWQIETAKQQHSSVAGPDRSDVVEVEWVIEHSK